MRIALLPPDERPNTEGYAAWIGRCAGVEVVLPPAGVMPRFRQPADTAGLADWLRAVDGTVDAIVVSLDLLVHGGLIPSRITDDRVREVVARLDVLAELSSPVTAYQVVTRLPHYDNATRGNQEPEYWATHGRRINELTVRWDEQAHGEADDDAVEAARAAVPAEYVQDVVRRRVRNHVVNLAALELVADGVLDALVITSDDTAQRGLPATERRAIGRWIDRLGVDVLLYPGADEVPSVLVARVAAQAAGLRPRIAVRCPEPGGLDRVAPYEDQPVGMGIARQIQALGAQEVAEPGDADLVLVVHAPDPGRGDWNMNPPTTAPEREARAMVAEVRAQLDAGRRVALADVRYANGSDPHLLQAMDDAGVLGRLASYGGWNTAGNTLGTTLAAGVSAVLDDSAEARAARRQYRAVKIIKDGHYLPTLRPQIQRELAERGLADPPLDEIEAVHERITRDLDTWAGTVQALEGVRVRNARMTWGYTFTIDFDLELPDV